MRDMRKYVLRCRAPLLKNGTGDSGVVLFCHGRNGGSCKRMNGAGKGKSCRGAAGLLLLFIFVEKKSDRRI